MSGGTVHSVLGAPFDGTTVGIVGAIVIVILAMLVAKIVRGDRGIRVVRFGVFIERTRFDEESPEDPTRSPRGGGKEVRSDRAGARFVVPADGVYLRMGRRCRRSRTALALPPPRKR